MGFLSLEGKEEEVKPVAVKSKTLLIELLALLSQCKIVSVMHIYI